VGAYGDNAGMDDLLTAMRDKVKQESTNLRYLRSVAIATELLGPIGDGLSLFFVPTGSPEESLGTEAGLHLYRATHEVDIVCVHYTASPFEEDAVIGTGRTTGLVGLVSDVLDYFSDNTLSLAGLEANMPPEIQAPSGAYSTFQIEGEERFLNLATLKYEATTKPFTRS